MLGYDFTNLFPTDFSLQVPGNEVAILRQWKLGFVLMRAFLFTLDPWFDLWTVHLLILVGGFFSLFYMEAQVVWPLRNGYDQR